MKIVIFGGSGGIGQKLIPLMNEHTVVSLSSKDVDITNLEAVSSLRVVSEADVVINLAGLNYDSFVHKMSANMPDINKMLDVNIKGNLNILASCLPGMRARGFGRIILISSVLSTRTVTGTSAYSASKSFIDTLARVTSAENISKGIACNSIQLGYFDAGMCHRLNEKSADHIKGTIGTGRWGSVHELHNLINFLIGTEYMTGQNIELSGGLI